MYASPKITDLAEHRMLRQKPVTDATAWLSAFEQIHIAHIRIAFAFWRNVLRIAAK